METQEVRAQWAERVAGWRHSGLTAKQYADSIGVKVGTLSYWAYRGLDEAGREKRRVGGRARYRAARKLADGQSESSLVEIVASRGRDERFELALCDGRRLQIPSSFSVAALERLLRVLEASR